MPTPSLLLQLRALRKSIRCLRGRWNAPNKMHMVKSTSHIMFIRILNHRLVCEVDEDFHKSNHSWNFTIQRHLHDLDRWNSSQAINKFVIPHGEVEGRHEELLTEAQLTVAAEEKEAHSFEIDPAQINLDVEMELKPHAQPRPYQEKSLSCRKSKVWDHCVTFWCWKVFSGGFFSLQD
ncbi:unnamed protein product [Lactuca virosa]|uniref:Uncharacterized protein n=1 Tax=Lactuca virosa TaxID=75947 RepID=A0AAU9PEP6_9ASTR|nr:unnamed protein product [Lactuca virosa]